MLRYFDLNNRARKAWSKVTEKLEKRQEEKSLLVEDSEALVEVEYDWNLNLGEKEEVGCAMADAIVPPPTSPAQLSLIRQIFMYFGIFIGILFTAVVEQFGRGENFNININVGTLLVSAIIALMLMPIVYEKMRPDPASPFIVQFGLFVQNGVFWHVFINSIGKI